MAIFDKPWNEHPLDWQILRNSPVALYFREETMAQDIEWFRRAEYDVFVFDCSGWRSASNFHNDVARGLEFPEYYGRNLDAFDDCISDLEVKDDGGVLLVFRRYDAFVQLDRKTAWIILDILANQSRIQSLLGRRLVTFAQSDDPAIQFDSVGASAVIWNPKELPDEKRGL